MAARGSQYARGRRSSRRAQLVLMLAGALAAIGCGAEDDDTARTPLAGNGGSGGVGGTLVPAGMSGSVAAAGAGAGMAGPPTFSAIFSEILTKGSVGNCTFGGCHGAPAEPTNNGNLKMVATDKEATYKALFNVKSTSPMCGGMTLVVPGNAQESLLIKKLGMMPPCGLQMPVMGLGNPLSTARLQQITTWIDNGALNN